MKARARDAELLALGELVIASWRRDVVRLCALNDLLAGRPAPRPRPQLRVIAGGRAEA